MFIAVILLSAVGTSMALHGWDRSVCQMPTPDVTHIRPIIATDYEVHVECDMSDRNLTTDIHEFFDYTNNRGLIRQHINGVEFFAYYDYKTNELLAIMPQKKMCQVSDLSKSESRYLFGDKTNGSKGHIFSAAGALHFGGSNYPEKYVNVTKVRGILVDHWYSCQYWKAMDATMTVDWYFTAKNAWDSAVGYPQAPVRVHVKGVRWEGTNSHNFDHTYEFFHFRPRIQDPRVFETPSGISCPGRKNTKPLPKVADGFSFTSEIVDLMRNTVSYMKEHFDGTMKIVRYTYRTLPIYPNPFGHNELTEIHDFNTGVAYVTDRKLGNCTAIPIESSSFDVATKQGSQAVRIRTAREFFYFNKGVQYTYEGVKSIREIDCDTWVSTRQFGGTNSTWEWYFASTSWNQTGRAVYDVPIPVQMRISVPVTGAKYQYNIFHFIRERPDLLHDDISACYEFRKRRVFRFRLSGQFRAQIDANLEMFKYIVLTTISSNTGLSVLRIQKLTFTFAQEIVVSFEMLDVAPTIGDVGQYPKEVPLDTAANTLIQKIKKRSFVVEMYLTTQKSPVYLVAEPNSVEEVKYVTQEAFSSTKTTGFTGGIMAAVALPLGVVGAGLGVVLTYIFFK